MPLAIVHHANQYLISDGYRDRFGIGDVVGSREKKRGLAHILELHRTYQVPANVHFSGTLLEALAWSQPWFLDFLKEICASGLVEIVGSAYGQNVMRFFDHDYNLSQLNEQLDVTEALIGVKPGDIRAFWPPERVWDTKRMAEVIRDPKLRNGGYQFVFVDDRLLVPIEHTVYARGIHDAAEAWNPELFQPCLIRDGHGLVAVPISAGLRQSIPPRSPAQLAVAEAQLRWLQSLEAAAGGADFLAVYADDMEKSAGLGWDPSGPAQFEEVLVWLDRNRWVKPVRISGWAESARMGAARQIDAGTYRELANDFNAGESYEKWYFDPLWAPYREYFEWSQRKVACLEALGTDGALIQLAKKHLLASTWETAWHTPAEGAHGNFGSDGGPSGVSRAVASHSRHAAVIAQAAHWQRHKDGKAHCTAFDIDGDGEEELIFRNANLFAVISPRHGGRLVALFSTAGDSGAMVVGNPTDDWNLQEGLNAFMDTPRNHPGAFTDVGFEHDAWAVEEIRRRGAGAQALLRNCQPGSKAFHAAKCFQLTPEGNALHVAYAVPAGLAQSIVEFGLSPDYLNLVRRGSAIVSSYETDGTRGFTDGETALWVRPSLESNFVWATPKQDEFGHGRTLRVIFRGTSFSIELGVDRGQISLE